MKSEWRPLIVHVVHRLDYGGLENGVVNLVNGLPPGRFRHSIIALTQASDFRSRLRSNHASLHVLDKRPGKDPGAYLRLYRLLRALRPAVVHTRNFCTLDCAVVARLAGVPRHVHGEHGWDMHDLEGTRRKCRLVRRLLNPMVDRFVVVSRELEHWVTGRIGIEASKVVRICNGVDTKTFRPATPGAPRSLLPTGWDTPGTVVIGTVARLCEIKDPLNLVRAFLEARKSPAGRAARLLIVGDGELKTQARELLREGGALEASWLTGARDDIPDLLRQMDLFVLGSRREGISNTVLEAMASGLPVIATATGGNTELVRHGVSGQLVPPKDSGALASALVEYLRMPGLRPAHGAAGRRLAEREYSLEKMIHHYQALYDRYTA